jgi:son of sevenless-like protein
MTGETDLAYSLFCCALYDYEAQYVSGLSFRRNDVIEVLTQAPSGWWDGLLGERRGWFPSNYVATFCRGLYDYETQNASSLAFHRDDIIMVVTQDPSGWWDGVLGDKRGWFPSNYVAVISDKDAVEAASVDALADDFWVPELSCDGRVGF